MLFYIASGTDVTGTVSGSLSLEDALDRSWYPASSGLDNSHPMACYEVLDGEVHLKSNWEEIKALAAIDKVPTGTAADYRTIKLGELTAAYGAAVYADFEHTDGNMYVGGNASAGLIQDGTNTQRANGETSITVWTIDDHPVPMALGEADALVAAMGKLIQAQFQYKKTIERQYLDVNIDADNARAQLDAITYDFSQI